MWLLAATACYGQTAGSPLPFVKSQFFTNTGQPAAGYKICTYTAGTTTPALTYTTSALNVANTNPVVLDAAGRADIFLAAASYKVALLLPSSTTTDCTDGTLSAVWTEDNIANNTDLLRAALAAPTGATLIGYEPTGGTVPITVARALNAYLMDAGYSTFAQACTAANNAGKTVLVTTAWAVQTGTYACDKWFLAGGKLRNTAASTATITGNLTAPPGQYIFDTTTNSGTILLPTPNQDIWANWFGTDTSGVTSSQPALTAAIAAIANGSTLPQGVTLRITAGTYLLDSTVTFTSSTMMMFAGAGSATNFTWSGNNSTPALLVQDCLQCEFKDFRITGNASHQLLYGMQTQNSGSGTRWTASLDRFVNITMNGVLDNGAGYITTGFYMGGGTDGNNDQQYFESVKIYNYTHSAFTINHSQIYDVTFSHCQFGAGGGSYGLEDLVGNFYWLAGGSSGGASIADFYYGGGNSATSVIDGGRYEGSPKFLVTPGPAYNGFTISLRNVNYAGNVLGCSAADVKAHACAATAPGGDAVTYLFAGSFMMDNCIFGTDVTVNLRLFLQPFDSTHFNFASIIGNQFITSQTTANGLFTAGLPSFMPDGSNFQYNPGTALSIRLNLAQALTPVTLPDAVTTIDVTNAPNGQLYLAVNTSDTAYDTITGMRNGQFFFVAQRTPAHAVSFVANAHNIQFAAGLSPLTASYENTLEFVCFSGVCSLVIPQ